MSPAVTGHWHTVSTAEVLVPQERQPYKEDCAAVCGLPRGQSGTAAVSQLGFCRKAGFARHIPAQLFSESHHGPIALRCFSLFFSRSIIIFEIRSPKNTSLVEIQQKAYREQIFEETHARVMPSPRNLHVVRGPDGATCPYHAVGEPQWVVICCEPCEPHLQVNRVVGKGKKGRETQARCCSATMSPGSKPRKVFLRRFS